MKLKIKFHKDYYALFSNIDNEDINAFYLVLVSHKSRKGGFEEPITEEECDKLLKKINPEYYYSEFRK